MAISSLQSTTLLLRSTRSYYFFDEVQYAQDWDRWLKIIYDTQPDTHVVATGSASPALMKGSRESGAGRWTVIQVPTMSSYEYCELLNLDRPNIASDLKVTTLLHKSQIQMLEVVQLQALALLRPYGASRESGISG